jgi:hypothetical protein
VGVEAKCSLTVGRTKIEGKALLETEALVFRGGHVRLAIRYKDIASVDARHGVLRVRHTKGTASFGLGTSAAKWAEKIRNPPSRADKLGIKAGQRVLIVGVMDAELRRELDSRAATILTRKGPDIDLVFFASNDRNALPSLKTLRQTLKPNGAIWVVRPKGSPAISEADVMRAGKEAGLVDVKVVRFSDTHTAEKFVIPVKERPNP